MSPTKTPTPKSTTLPRNALTSPLFSQAEAYRRYALTHIPEHPIKRLDELLTDKKVNHLWHLDNGAHEWPVWKNDLYLFGQRVFKAS